MMISQNTSAILSTFSNLQEDTTSKAVTTKFLSKFLTERKILKNNLTFGR